MHECERGDEGLGQRCGARPSARRTPLDGGAQLGPYEIVDAIGAGAMGKVYRARDPRLGRYVAIKVLASHVAANREAAARFEERGARRRGAEPSQHPRAARRRRRRRRALRGDGAARGRDAAHARSIGGPLPPRQALELAAEIAEGLGAAHERGIVHCDLKPENLFLTRDGHVKILDFGIARREPVDSSSDETRPVTARACCSARPAYIAPEQIEGRPASAQVGHLRARHRALRDADRARTRSSAPRCPRRSPRSCVSRRRRSAREVLESAVGGLAR